MRIFEEVKSDAEATESVRRQREIDEAIKQFKPLLVKARQTDQQEGAAIPTTLSADEVKRLLEQGSGNLLPQNSLGDDHPINNQRARLALAALGVYCDSYT